MNPNSMPCESQEFQNNKVQLGQYVLSDSQIGQLSQYKDFIPTSTQRDNIIYTTKEFFEKQGYEPLVQKENWLYTRNKGASLVNSEDDQIGDVRICFKSVPCSEITIVAQQMEDINKSTFTFRQWNPQ